MMLDTHAVIWLYQGNTELFTQKGISLLESELLSISPVVLLELQYLYEIKRISALPVKITEYLEDKIGLTLSDLSLLRLVSCARKQDWTRDPFDRLIASHAQAEEELLLTKDNTILDHYKRAVW